MSFKSIQFCFYLSSNDLIIFPIIGFFICNSSLKICFFKSVYVVFFRDLIFIFGERIYYETVRVNDISKKGKKNKLKIKKSNKVRK